MYILFFCIVIYFNKIFKKQARALAWVKNSKVMPQLPHYLSFLLEREENPYASNPIKTFKILQSALSDQKTLTMHWFRPPVCLQLTSKLSILQNFMYILCKFCTFPVTEGNEILHLHFSL